MSLTRSDYILKLIVEYFIKTAEPVASSKLIEEYNLPYSSATIRNEMYALEKMGLIEKTHTSSGRVPSSQGYKYYCENLRDKGIDENLKRSLQTVLESKIQSVEEVIKESCEILSEMTSLVSVVTGNNEEKEKLANVQIIQVSNNTLTAIFVTDKGYVESKTFIVQDTFKGEEIVSCVKLLNERLKGTPVNDLVEKMESIKPVLSDYIVNHNVIYQALLETFIRFTNDRLSLYGRNELFNHPEFKNDAEKLEKVMKLLGNTSVFKEIEKESREMDNKIHLKIGDINDNPDLAMVSTKVKFNNEDEQTITLLGPTRMDYDKALSALEYLSEELTKYFNKLNGGNNDGGDA
jgi:heat-inducible transcriptional repressor